MTRRTWRSGKVRVTARVDRGVRDAVLVQHGSIGRALVASVVRTPILMVGEAGTVTGWGVERDFELSAKGGVILPPQPFTPLPGEKIIPLAPVRPVKAPRSH